MTRRVSGYGAMALWVLLLNVCTVTNSGALCEGEAPNARAQDAESPELLFARAHGLLSERQAGTARQALPLLKQALEGFRSTGQEDRAAETLYALAVAAGGGGDRDAAIQWNQKAVAAFESLGDRAGWAASHDHWGSLLAQAGQGAAALGHLRSAVTARAELGDAGALASSLHNLASAQFQVGEAESAREHFERALEIHRATGDLRAEAAGLNNLGLLWLYLGRYDTAAEMMTGSLILYRQLGDLRAEAGCLNNLGLIAAGRGLEQEALKRLQRARELHGRLDDPRGLAEVLGNLGWVSLSLGDVERAESWLLRAGRLASQNGLEGMEASLMGSLGRAQLAKGAAKEGLSTLETAARRLRRLGAVEDLRVTLHDLARAQLSLGQRDQAEESIRGAIRLVESSRSGLRPFEARAHFFAPRRRLYDFLVDLLMEQGRYREALEVSETARARGLLDRLRRRSDDASVAGVNDAGSSFDFQAVGDLGPEVAEAWIYHFGERKSWLWRWRRDGLSGHDLGPSAVLARIVEKGTQSLVASRRRSQRGPALKALRELSHALLVRAPGEAPGAIDGHWLVAADGPIYRVPFAALAQSGSGDSPVVVMLPSLSVLAELRRAPKPQRESGRLLVVADPVFESTDPRLAHRSLPPDPSLGASGTRVPRPGRLPFSGVEAESIAALLPAQRVTLHTGLHAARPRLLGSPLNDYRWLHFATHATVDEQRPERTALWLSTFDPQGRPVEGRLRLRDLADLSLSADLVTLSACGSATGKPLTGEGLIGLSRSFFMAGAQALVASLWDVDDRAAALLMSSFYRSLLAGQDAATALAEAQREVRSRPQTRAPFYWAGYVMTGDWR